MIRRVAPALLSFAAFAALSAAGEPAYLAADGSIRINGAEHVKPILEKIDVLYVQTHPGARFTLDLKGTSSAIPDLTHGVTLFAPMGREISPQELVPYMKIVGAPPLEIRIAHDSADSRTLATSLAVYVNVANPIGKLTVEQLGRIFTTGAPHGDFTRWSQAGVAGDWGKRPVHPVGTPSYTGFGDYLGRHLYAGRPLAPGYELAPETDDILRRVAGDPEAIGIAAAGRAGPGLKRIELSTKPDPLARFLFCYIRRASGRPLDPIVRDYFQLLLSPEGQRIVGDSGYGPLTPQEAAAELAKLDEVMAAGPAPVDPPADGSIYLVGDDGMQGFVEKLDALYQQAHPGTRFALNLKGSSTGIGGLTAGVSAIAPMGRDGWAADLSGFKETYGGAPLDVHVGYDGYTHEAGKSPPGIYVNAKNPVASLTVRQIAQIFTSGSPGGDLTHWSQVGTGGAKRSIHVYGPPDDGGFATAFRLTLLAKQPFGRAYESLPKNADIAKAVAEDPFGIGLISFFDGKAAQGIRMLPIAAEPSGEAVLPTYENVHAGRYPLVPFLRLYAVRVPGRALDRFAAEYARLALSPEGQRILADERGDEGGYVPLNPDDIAAELAKLQ